MDKTEDEKAGQQPNIQVKGEVAGNLSVDRHDTTINQSVADVKAQRDAVIATSGGTITQVKKIFVEVIPSWVWIVTLLTLFGYAVWVGISQYKEKENQEIAKILDEVKRHEEELKIKRERKAEFEEFKFKPGEVGIAVANFGPSVEGNTDPSRQTVEIARGQNYATKLSVALKKFERRNVIVKKIPFNLVRYITEASEAELFGKKAAAKLVVCGKVGLEGKEEETIISIIQPISSEKDHYKLKGISKDLGTVEFRNSRVTIPEIEKYVNKLMLFILGYVYYMQAENPEDPKWKDAVQYFQQALEQKITLCNVDAYTHLYLGNTYYYTNKDQDAEREYSEAQRVSQQEDLDVLMEVWNNLGILALHRYELNVAHDYFLKANDSGNCVRFLEQSQEKPLNPSCVHLFYNLADVSVEQENYAAATDYGERALNALQRIREGFSTLFSLELYTLIAYAHIEQGQIEKAQAYLATVTQILEHEPASRTELNPGRGAWHRNWGRIYLRSKDWERALEHFQQAKVVDPENPIVHLLLAQLHNERCQPGDQARYFDEKLVYFQAMQAQNRETEGTIRFEKLQGTCNQ